MPPFVQVAFEIVSSRVLIRSWAVFSDVMSHQQGLPKMGKLRLFITFAKLRHLECSWDEAF